MKTWKAFWGIGFIVAAVVLILDAVGVMTPLFGVIGEISVFSVVAGLFFVAVIVSQCFSHKKNYSFIFFSLAFLFILFEGNIAKLLSLPENFIHNGLVLLAALLLTIGFSALFPQKRRYRIRKIEKRRGGKATYTHTGEHAESSLGSAVIYIDSATLSPSSVENNLGSCTVHFENTESFVGGGTVYVENNLGAMVVNVPSEWQVKADIENSLGYVQIPQDNSNDKELAPVLYIRGENSLGSLTVKYI